MLKAYFTEDKIEAGCDEAGRGCLAGPVTAAAVILPRDFENEILTDSKKLSEKKRYELRPIIEKEALAWAVAFVDNEKIDEINILKASHLAMHLAAEKLSERPELLLIDGNRYTSHNETPYECIVKGDGKYLSIAAASVLAKTYRDDLMDNLHAEFPNYDWTQNKGYPTVAHRAAIAQYGITPYHRKTFRLNEQLKIDFGS